MYSTESSLYREILQSAGVIFLFSYIDHTPVAMFLGFTELCFFLTEVYNRTTFFVQISSIGKLTSGIQISLFAAF